LFRPVEPRRDRDAGDREVGRRGAVDSPQVAQMSGAGGDEALAFGLDSRAATTGQAILLGTKGRRGRRSLRSLFVLSF